MSADKWKEYFYVCTMCDASLSVATNKEPVRNPRCVCDSSKITLIQIKEIKEGEL